MHTRSAVKLGILSLALLLGLVSTPLSLAGEYTTSEVALDGYCPVAYAAMNKAVKGDPEFASEYQGRTYYLTNAKAKKMFDKSPEAYAVAFDGWCATGMAHGMKVESDPTLFIVRDGRTCLFANEEAKAMFTKDAARVVAQADSNWSSLGEGR